MLPVLLCLPSALTIAHVKGEDLCLHSEVGPHGCGGLLSQQCHVAPLDADLALQYGHDKAGTWRLSHQVFDKLHTWYL